MDDLKRIEGKSIKSIERDSNGENSYLIIKFKEGGKMNVVSSPSGDGVGQLDVVGDGIKLEDSIGKVIHNVIEEFDGENDYLILNLKGGGKININAFGSSESSNAVLSVDVYVEPKTITENKISLNNMKKLVPESLNEAMRDTAPGGDDFYDKRNDWLDDGEEYTEDPTERKIAKLKALAAMRKSEAGNRAEIQAKKRKVSGGLKKLRDDAKRNKNTYDGTHDEDAAYKMDKVKADTIFDPYKFSGDKSAIGVGGQYRADDDNEIEVSPEQVDAAWAFVDKKQELVDRAIKSGATPEVMAKRQKYLNDAIQKAEELESNL